MGGTILAMKKLILAVVLGVLVATVFAAPAFALRDPFDPTIDLTPASSDTTGGGTTVVTNEEAPTTEPQVITNENGSEALANTGAHTEPWVVLAYGLLAAGCAALALAKVRTLATTS